MRTPITAEALRAAGWEEFAPDWYRRILPEPEFIDIYIGADPPGLKGVGVDTNDDGIHEWMPGLQTMYDLRELRRLLGGAK